MRCTFYFPESRNMDEWENIREKMRFDVNQLNEHTADAFILRCYLERLLPQATALENTPGMRFFGLGDPRSMPGDIRVEYFYWTTYIATTFCMKAILLCPCVIDMIGEDMAPINGEEALEILSECMRGCTGRGFAGHGCDDISGLVEAMDFFTEHRVQEFLEKYPELCPEYNECFHRSADFFAERVRAGKVTGSWGDEHTERARRILDRLGMNEKKEVC